MNFSTTDILLLALGGTLLVGLLITAKLNGKLQTSEAQNLAYQVQFAEIKDASNKALEKAKMAQEKADSNAGKIDKQAAQTLNQKVSPTCDLAMKWLLAHAVKNNK